MLEILMGIGALVMVGMVTCDLAMMLYGYCRFVYRLALTVRKLGRRRTGAALIVIGRGQDDMARQREWGQLAAAKNRQRRRGKSLGFLKGPSRRPIWMAAGSNCRREFIPMPGERTGSRSRSTGPSRCWRERYHDYAVE